ncbi:MAG: hydrogenase iron-sulfur subunit [Candidatus Bathyarchaeota archaeon]|nr:MAG: hydrogenase iron-sulfur subunit [Candidatus Bathyarchaeota archaeon]
MLRPKIIGFVCNWSKPPEIQTSEPSGFEGHPKIHMIQVMCVGRIDPVIVLDAFVRGADGVLMVGCPSPDCHYVEGNTQAKFKVKMLKKLLALAGIKPDRLLLDWAHMTDVESFVKIVDNFRNLIIAMGQSPLNGGDSSDDFLLNLRAAKNTASDFRLRVLTGREGELTQAESVYGETIPANDFDRISELLTRMEFIRHKIHLLAIQEPVSVKQLAERIKEKPSFVLCQIVEMRRRGMVTLDEIKGTTPLYKGLEV